MKKMTLFFLVACLLTLSACQDSKKNDSGASNSSSSPAEASSSAKISDVGSKPLVLDLVAEPVSMDPQQVNDINSHRVHFLMYDTLVGWDSKGFNMVPQLAESWKISDDGLQYEFKLHKDIKFHDGTPLDSAAVKFTFDHILDKKNPDYNGPYPLADVYYGVISKIETPDPLTVKFLLKQKNAPFISNLTATSAAIVSPTAVKKYGKDTSLHDLGSGPFMMEDWQKGVQVKLKANPNYWNGTPKVSSVIIQPVVDPLVRVTKLKTGEADIIADVDPDSIDDLKKNKFDLLEQQGPHLWYATMNASKKPFNDVRVRQAVNYAIDKKAIVDNILKGTGTVATQPLSPVYNGYDPSIKGYEFDPEKAKKLLADAGYPNGFTIKFLVPESGSGMQSPVPMSTAIQGYLKAVGINAEIQKMEWGTFLSTSQNEKNRGGNAPYDMWAISWMNVTGDADGTIANLFSAHNMPLFNSGFYKNDEVTKYLDDAALETDLKKRGELYRKASAIITNEAPMVFLDWGMQTAAAAPSIKGFALHPSHMFDLKNVTK